MNFSLSLGLAASLLLATVPETSHAAYVSSIEQVGTDVVSTGSGSIDTQDLHPNGGGLEGSGFVAAYDAVLALGPISLVPFDNYDGFVGPTSFGPGAFATADSGSGPYVIIAGDTNLQVPQHYVSGTALGTSTDTYFDTTLAALGLDAGLYEWTWGSGADADSFSLQIGPPAAGGAVPEPASLTLLGLGLAAIGVARRKQAR